MKEKTLIRIKLVLVCALCLSIAAALIHWLN